MPHLPPAHHETSKHDSPNETKIKEKQNETIPDSNSNLAKSMTHHNQTTELTTWFLTRPMPAGRGPCAVTVCWRSQGVHHGAVVIGSLMTESHSKQRGSHLQAMAYTLLH
jgi:hypothetical protein